jgi:hypothetical protein
MRVLTVLVAFAAGICATASPGSEDAATNANIALQDLKRDLLAGTVKNVRVFYVPYEVATRVPLTPELLRGSAEIDRVVAMDDAIRTRLLAAIDKTTISPLDTSPDLRWGAIFLSDQAGELHSVYLDGRYLLGTGRRGIVDGNPVKLNGALIEWFEAAFGGLIRTPTR